MVFAIGEHIGDGTVFDMAPEAVESRRRGSCRPLRELKITAAERHPECYATPATEMEDLDIDSFVLTRRFTPRKWTALLIRNKLEPSTAKRNISTKVLADVVESLIGAAYVDGGIREAQACLHRILPEINLFTNNISPLILPQGKGVSNLINHHRLAGLLGYTFNDPAPCGVVESEDKPHSRTINLQRLR
ncbi:hypothetical protein N7534_010923 [Penicillium rubens]|nr:hypothetical protein N7534_010923 [Penicillium rubens]